MSERQARLRAANSCNGLPLSACFALAQALQSNFIALQLPQAFRPALQSNFYALQQPQALRSSVAKQLLRFAAATRATP